MASSTSPYNTWRPAKDACGERNYEFLIFVSFRNTWIIYLKCVNPSCWGSPVFHVDVDIYRMFSYSVVTFHSALTQTRSEVNHRCGSSKVTNKITPFSSKLWWFHNYFGMFQEDHLIHWTVWKTWRDIHSMNPYQLQCHLTALSTVLFEYPRCYLSLSLTK